MREDDPTGVTDLQTEIVQERVPCPGRRRPRDEVERVVAVVEAVGRPRERETGRRIDRRLSLVVFLEERLSPPNNVHRIGAVCEPDTVWSVLKVQWRRVVGGGLEIDLAYDEHLSRFEVVEVATYPLDGPVVGVRAVPGLKHPAGQQHAVPPTVEQLHELQTCVRTLRVVQHFIDHHLRRGGTSVQRAHDGQQDAKAELAHFDSFLRGRRNVMGVLSGDDA